MRIRVWDPVESRPMVARWEPQYIHSKHGDKKLGHLGLRYSVVPGSQLYSALGLEGPKRLAKGAAGKAKRVVENP